LADCIAQPNVATGLYSIGIAGIVYGVNGVCHHMANRILSAANVELPRNIAQIRAMRTLYRGGAFGRNLRGQPPEDQWPNRRILCAAAPAPAPGSIGASTSLASSSFPNPSEGSGLMSFDNAEDEFPDPRSELSNLIEAGLGHPIEDPQVFEGLLDMQTRLHAEQETLADLFLARDISREQYISRLDAIMRDAARTGARLLGDDDFHKIFGEFAVHNIVDVNAFIGGQRPAAR